MTRNERIALKEARDLVSKRGWGSIAMSWNIQFIPGLPLYRKWRKESDFQDENGRYHVRALVQTSGSEGYGTGDSLTAAKSSAVVSLIYYDAIAAYGR
jgi:hypothetical protein